jgi:hypothetical protein
MIERRNEQGESYKRVFIHFEYWFNTRESHAAREKLCAGKEIKVVYDDPWFWKVSINNWKAEQQPVVRGPHIDWEEDKRPEPSRRPEPIRRPESSRRPEPSRRPESSRRPGEPSRREPEIKHERREPEDRRRVQEETRRVHNKKPEPNAVPIVALPVKQRVLVKKQKKPMELEEGEVVDGELTEEEKQLADALYGDL